MEFVTTASAASRRSSDCVIVGVYERGQLGQGAADIDAASKGILSQNIKDGIISGRLGTSLLDLQECLAYLTAGNDGAYPLSQDGGRQLLPVRDRLGEQSAFEGRIAFHALTAGGFAGEFGAP